MAYWLLKTEPSDFSYEQLAAKKRATWDGVGNNQALIHMRNAKKGDRVLIYHTGDVKAAVGLAKLVSDPYPDPKADNAKLVVFDVAPEKALAKPVTLADVKASPKFKTFELVRNSRLSVMPVSDEHWKLLMAMAGEK